MSLRFGTDGIRGLANAELTPEIALALGRAAARHLGNTTFLIGSDTRRSSAMLEAALAAGLASEGASVHQLGVLPTPAVAWLAATRHLPAAVISASHNPYPDNGIKLLSPEGAKLSDALERAIETELDVVLADPQRASRGAPIGLAVGEIVTDHGAVLEYEDHLCRSVDLSVGRPLSVVCDCANGAASEIAPRVLRRLGVEVATLADHPNGANINAQCGSTDTSRLAGEVVARGADLGVAFDGDADRLIAIDHRGDVVDGDRLLALFALDLASRGELANDAIVITVMSNLGLRRALKSAAIEVIETPVGDRHVADAIDAHNLVLGGEQSGHIVFRRYATTGDGILTALKLLELVAASKDSLAEMATKSMTRLPQELRNVVVDDPRRLGSSPGIWSEVDAVEALLGDRGRVLLRSSGTEAAVRVMVEAETAELAASAVERLVAAVQRELAEVAR